MFPLLLLQGFFVVVSNVLLLCFAALPDKFECRSLPSSQNMPASQDSPSMSCGVLWMIRTGPSLFSGPLHMLIDEGGHFHRPSTASVHNRPGFVGLHGGGGQRVPNLQL